MPELPEVETVRRGLQPVMEGRRIVRVEQRRADLRFPFPLRFAERLEGRTVLACGRRAKYLLFDLDAAGNEGAAVLVMHLGMSGSFRIGGRVPGAFHHARATDPRHDHVVFHMEDGTTATYNDPRRFGFMDIVAREAVPEHSWFASMGLEPFGSNGFDAVHLAGRLRGKAAPLKSALLDQRVIAGLGNIYVCEALHRARLSPRRLSGTLVRRDGRPTQRLERLTQEIRLVIAEAVEAGGSSLRDHRQADGQMGYFQHSFRVYDREAEPCPTPNCSGTVQRIAQGGRSTFFCGSCQR